MFKKIAILFALGFALSGCANNSSKDGEIASNDIKNLEMTVIKLYATSNLDSAFIIDTLNKESKEGKSTDETLKTFGTYFTDVKISFKLENKKDVEFVSTNTTSHVAGVSKDGELIPGFYNTGIKALFNIQDLGSNRYLFNYNIKNSILKRLEQSSSNKIITTPEINIREINQTIVIDESMDKATATEIINQEPKQYELYLFKITKGN